VTDTNVEAGGTEGIFKVSLRLPGQGCMVRGTGGESNMLRWVLLLALCAASVFPVAAFASNSVAPADEYFGPTKMSVLGIRNTVQDTQIRASGDPDRMMGKYWTTLVLAHQALDEWARRFPHDSWLPRNAFLMARLFDHVHTAEGDAAAADCRSILFRNFAGSWFARAAHDDLTKLGKH
jgi:hypothetical protein